IDDRRACGRKRGRAKMGLGRTAMCSMNWVAAAVFFALALLASADGASAQDAPGAREGAPPTYRARPPRITVTPRGLGPNATRRCTAWLAQEYRPSGTVIVPRMNCWWV